MSVAVSIEVRYPHIDGYYAPGITFGNELFFYAKGYVILPCIAFWCGGVKYTAFKGSWESYLYLTYLGQKYVSPFNTHTVILIACSVRLFMIAFCFESGILSSLFVNNETIEISIVSSSNNFRTKPYMDKICIESNKICAIYRSDRHTKGNVFLFVNGLYVPWSFLQQLTSHVYLDHLPVQRPKFPRSACPQFWCRICSLAGSYPME